MYCNTCRRKFKRKDILKRHQDKGCSPPATKPEKKDKREKQIPAKRRQPSAKKQPQPKRLRLDEEMGQYSPEISSFMEQHWSSIRRFSKMNRVQSVFNFYYDNLIQKMKKEIAHQILAQITDSN